MTEPYRAIEPLPPNRIVVPVVKQETDFSCGAAATLSMLRLWRWGAFRDVGERSLYAALDTTEARGTEPEPMVEVLRRAGLDAVYRHGDVTLAQLERAVDAGEPPIVDLQAWRDDRAKPWSETWDAGHYVLLVGYDAERLYVMDPSVLTKGGYAHFPRAELAERWHDLAGPEDARLERMVVFVRGGERWVPDEPPEATATLLG
ncbi:MAG TPA: C39 family peptidase [Polyangiaceae bacterium]|jgi:predicted double-glycine peptidase